MSSMALVQRRVFAARIGDVARPKDWWSETALGGGFHHILASKFRTELLLTPGSETPVWRQKIQQLRFPYLSLVFHPAMAEPDVFDPYDILGVRGDATLEEIGRAYHRLALQHDQDSAAFWRIREARNMTAWLLHGPGPEPPRRSNQRSSSFDITVAWKMRFEDLFLRDINVFVQPFRPTAPCGGGQWY
eukprot:s1048_g15.t1